MGLVLYHGSYIEVVKPDLSFSRDNLDFGKGFYVTPIKEHAVKWSARFKRRRGHSVVSHYAVSDMTVLTHEANTKIFETYSEEWLEFIIACRSGNDSSDFDVVIGGIANDKVFDTIQLYLDGLVDKSAALQRLAFDEPNVQYCFRNQNMIDAHMTFLESEAIL